MHTNTLYDRILNNCDWKFLMIFIQNGAILGNLNVYIFLDINHAITRGLHRPGSSGGGGAFQNMYHGKQPYEILGIIRGCFVCVFQKSSLANNYIVEYIIPTEKYIANTNIFMSDHSINEYYNCIFLWNIL